MNHTCIKIPQNGIQGVLRDESILTFEILQPENRLLYLKTVLIWALSLPKLDISNPNVEIWWPISQKSPKLGMKTRPAIECFVHKCYFHFLQNI